MLPVPVDSSLRYRRGVAIAETMSPISRRSAMVNSSPSTPPPGAGGRLQRCPPAPAAWCSRVDICRPAPSVLVDDVASRHRQSKVGLVVKLVEHAPEHRGQFLQIRWKREGEPESLGDPQVQIGQEVELKPGAPAYAATVLW